MVIDSSALVAILLAEPDALELVQKISVDSKRLLSAVSLLETSLVLESRKGLSGGRDLDLFLHSAQINIAAMTREQADLAREAYRRFGKGRHPARLNMGDCCSYALARHSGEPLLFKGNDFSQTDVRLVE